MASYSSKKKECEKRMIPFLFTQNSWKKFDKLKDCVKCAYTNHMFVPKSNHQHEATLERIDETKGYSPDNCVWVTRQANQLKAAYIENGRDTSKLDEIELGYLRRIQRIIESVENIQKIQEPYKHLFNTDNLVEEQTKEETNIMSKTYDFENTDNPELAIARLYAHFGAMIEQTFKSEFPLTFTQFKVLCQRKKCMLTGQDLPEKCTELGFFIKDKTSPVTKDNIVVTTKLLQESLDNMCATNSLSFNDLKIICKALIK